MMSQYEKKDNAPEELKTGGERDLKGIFAKIVLLLGVIFGLFQVFVLAIYPINPWVMRAVHFGAVGAICFLVFSAKKNSARNQPPIIDICMAALLLGTGVYIVFNYEAMLTRIGVAPTNWDLFFGTVAIVGLIEMTRRTTGWALPILAII